MKKMNRKTSSRLSIFLTFIMLASYLGAAFSLSTRASDLPDEEELQLIEEAMEKAAEEAASSDEDGEAVNSDEEQDETAVTETEAEPSETGKTGDKSAAAADEQPDIAEADGAAAGDEEPDISEPAAASVPSKFDSASAVNYATILGRATDFGIVANKYHQKNHMETTMAVNYFKNNDQNNDVDFIYGTAQFLFYEVQSGTIRLGITTASTVNIEASPSVMEGYSNPYTSYPDSYESGKNGNFTFDGGFFTNKPKITTNTNGSVSDNINRIINNAAERSETINEKSGDEDYALNASEYYYWVGGKAKLILNLSKDSTFENKVVYINVDNDLDSAMRDGKLRIVKPSSTIVCFNYPSTMTDIKIGRVYINTDGNDYEGNEGRYISSVTGNGGGTTAEGHTNDDVDREICQKIIFNVPGSGEVRIDAAAGTFLIPDEEANVYVDGSAAGWVVTGGHMENDKEWHYIYRGGSQDVMTDGDGEIHFAARKSFTEEYNGRDTKEDTSVYTDKGTYGFNFYETYNNSDKNKWTLIDTVYNQATNTIKFPTLSFTAVEVRTPANYTHYEVPLGNTNTYYYRINELGAGGTVTNTDGKTVELSRGYIDIILKVTNDNGTLRYVVSSKTVLGDGNVYKTNENVTMSGVEFTLGAFFNKLKDETESNTGTVYIEKLDAADNTPLPGATLRLTAENGMAFTAGNVTLGEGASLISVNGSVLQFKTGTGRTIFTGLKPGKYTLSEVEAPEGYKLSTGSISFTVNNDGSVVNANGNSILEGSIYLLSFKNDKLTVSGEASASITINKRVEVPNGKFDPKSAKGYQFRLVCTSGNDETEYADVTSNANGAAGFSMKYTKAGTYEYTLTEVTGTAKGIEYDNTEYKVVVVVEEGAGRVLVDPATVTICKDGVAISGTTASFTNKYEVEELKVNIGARKVLSNGTLADGQFTFKITAVSTTGSDPCPMPAGGDTVTNNADGSINFEIEYDTPGTYVYTLSEDLSGLTNVSQIGTKTITATVVISDNGDGTLASSVTYNPKNNTFTNKYNKTTFDIEASKILNGIAPRDGAFSFKLSFNGKEYTETNGTLGSIVFKNLEVPAEDGSYEFTISELIPDEKEEGMVYAEPIKGTVTVSGGNATYTYENGKNTLVNEQKTVRFTVSFNKVDETSKSLPGAKFTLTKDEGDMSFNDGKVSVKQGTNDVGSYTESSASFTSSGVRTVFQGLKPGNYTLHEDAAPVGYGKAADIKFTIAEDGSVSADPAGILNNGIITIKNIKKNISTSVNVPLSVTKAMVIDTPGGKDPGVSLAGYTFELRDAESNNLVATATSDSEGRLTFDNLWFKELGTFEYTLTERKESAEGISYDGTVYHVSIETVDDDDDNEIDLPVSLTITKDGKEVSDISFVNHYKAASVSVNLLAYKYMDDDEAAAGEFAFQLKPKGSSVGSVVRNAANGVIKYSLSYDAPGTYEYILSEMDEGKQGVKYDNRTYNVKVVVTDNGNGNLKAVLTTDPALEKIIFENESKLFPIQLQKLDEEGAFLSGATLQLSKAGDDLDFTNEKITVIGATGSITREKTCIKFNTAGSFIKVNNLPAGTYVLSETIAPSGYSKANDIIFTIADDGGISTSDGSALVVKEGVDTLTMVDKSGSISYNGAVNTSLLLGKTVTDAAGTAPAVALSPKGYKAVLSPVSDNARKLFENDLEGSFDEEGKLEISIGDFKEAGTYSFELYEEEGAKSGITYDSTIYDVLVLVTADDDGKLQEPELSITRRGDTAAVREPVPFENQYRAMPVELEITAKKIFEGDGATLSSGKFEFELELEQDPANNIEASTILTSNTSGDVVFKISYNKPGVYRYKMTEKLGSRSDIKYDTETSYNITVEVKDDGNGILQTYMITEAPAGGYTFTNKYEKDENTSYFAIEARKHLTGDLTDGHLLAGDFSFTLEIEGDSTIYRADNELGGAIHFTDLPAPRAAGDYKFTIKEVIPTTTEDPTFGGTWVYGSPITGIVRIADGKDPQVIFDKNVNEIYNNFTYTLPRFNLTVDKKIEKYDGESLEGAKLRFTRDDGNFDFTDPRTLVTQGNEAARDLVKTKDAIYFTSSTIVTVITGIPSGNYTLTELSAPEGYDKAAPIHFTVDANGNVSSSDPNNNNQKAIVVMIDDPWPVENEPSDTPTPTPKKSSGKDLTPTPKGQDGYGATPTPTPYGWKPTPTPYGWDGVSTLTPTPYGWDGTGTPTILSRGGRVVTRAGDDSSPKTGDRTNPAGIFAAVGVASMIALIALQLMDKRREKEE